MLAAGSRGFNGRLPDRQSELAVPAEALNMPINDPSMRNGRLSTEVAESFIP